MSDCFSFELPIYLRTARDSISVFKIQEDGQAGKYLDVNDTFCREVGFTQEELLQMSPGDLYPGTESEREKALAELLDKGIVIVDIILKDGERLPLEISGHLFTIVGQQAMLTISRDITDRKILEAEVVRKEEVYEKLLYALSDAIIIHDGKTVLYANNGAVKLAGTENEQQLINTSVAGFIHPDYLGMIEERTQRLLKEKIQLPVIEIKMVSCQGEIKDVEVAAMLFVYQGRDVMLSVIRDISCRKQLEKEVKEAQLQRERDRRIASLGLVSAGIAHEIRQPLNSLKVTLCTMLYRHKTGRSLQEENSLESLDKMKRQIDRMDDIIKYISDMVHNNRDIALVPCDLNKEIAETLQNIKLELKAKGIEIVLLFSKVSLIRAESVRLQQLLYNLLKNAVDAFQGIKRDPKKIYCMTKVNGEYVSLEISDNAIGIQDDFQDKIFEPFFTTKETGEGMGLGLTIVHAIITVFNANIYMLNNEAGGATFRVDFIKAEDENHEHIISG